MRLLRCITALPSLVVVAILICITDAQSSDQANTGNFFNPTAATGAQDLQFNTVWNIGDKMTVKWKTSIDNYTIAFYQNVPGVHATKGPSVHNDTQTGTQQFDWVVSTLDFKLSDSPVYFFWLGQGSLDDVGPNNPGFTSSYFNISKASNNPSTTSSSTTSSSTPSPSPSSNGNNGNSTSAPAPVSSPGSSSISGGAIGGIVVGVVAGLAVAGAAAFFLIRRWRQKKNAKAAALSPNMDETKQPASGEFYAPLPQKPVEMEGNGGRKPWMQHPAELENSGRMSELDSASRSDVHSSQPSELP